ncbi:MAG: rRNA maturation RNase YbeY [Candidatus Acidiferrales bacterium]|jgi:probable rRNA maturation factor
MVINRQRRVRVALRPLEQFVDRVQRALRLRECDLTVCLVSDAVIARLNRSYLGKRGPTDVLSFPAERNGAMPRPKENAPTQRTQRTQKTHGTQRNRTHREEFSAASFGGSSSYLGDIAISPETARRSARRFSHPLPQELRMLVLHGVLHLIGYDHETDRGEMDLLERRLRRRLRLG